jgi:hypothetical protein
MYKQLFLTFKFNQNINEAGFGLVPPADWTVLAATHPTW